MLQGMWPLRCSFFLLLVSAEGAPQKYRVEPNGQLSVSRDRSEGHVAENEQGRQNATGGVMRREAGIATLDDGALVQQQQKSTGFLQCGWTAFAPDDPCPTECPLLAEESWNPCHFQCVAEDQCGVLDPKATIADYTQKRCRRCIVAGCDVCASGGKDKCFRCSMGYILDNTGKCYSGGWYVWVVFKTVAFFVGVILLLWLLELVCRRPTNLKGLKHGMQFRKRTRCHMPRDTPEKLGVIDPDDSSGLIYPLSTNLLVTPVGGAATSLHFSFQAYVILWAAGLCFAWGYWAKQYGYDLIKLGTLPAHTPQQLCSVIKWGAKTQEKMFEDKFYFICWAYMFQFITCIAFAWYQQVRFHMFDDSTTMKDYACYVRGLPSFSGEENVEANLKEYLEEKTGQKLVGVSCAWNMMQDIDGHNAYEQVEHFLEEEAKAQEKAHALLKNGGQEPEDDEIVIPRGGLTAAFSTIDRIVGFGGKDAGEKEEDINVEQVRKLLEKMKTSDVCFAVFESEADRDKAVERCKQNKGFVYPDHDKNIVRLETKACEPGTVRWHGLSLGSRTSQRNKKMAVGVLFVLLCLILWCVLFYLPYAYYVSAFTYANGNEPTFVANMVFTLLVVAGNQAMYFVADAITVWADFGFEDDREFWYNVYYLVACVLNVVCDLIVTGYLSYREMVGIGVHTADGKLLSTMTSFQDIVESYPMQKTMGRMLFAYCFPGTFLTPFLIEPLATITAPYVLGRYLLRSHREYQNRDAELSMAFFQPMNLGRYSDHLLNMSLAVMVLYLPGGYVMPMFMAMALSHIYIYAYDHWRVLRASPDFCFSRNVVDKFGSSWMALPCALTASCAVFKGYHIFWPDLNGQALTCVMLWAFMGHIFVHTWMMNKIYKMKKKHKKAEQPYAETAKYTANTWFSMNPVHCLRSKYLWGHEPAQVFYICGKEHLQRENAEHGAFFEDKKAQKPDPPKEKVEPKKVTKTAAGKAKDAPKTETKALAAGSGQRAP